MAPGRVERVFRQPLQPGMGIEATKEVLGQLLQQRNVTWCKFSTAGVEYGMLVSAEEDSAEPVSLQLDTVSPFWLVRASAVILEVPTQETLLGSLLGALQTASVRRLWPIGWVISPNSFFWRLFAKEFYLETREDMLGFPVYLDAQLEEDTVLLAAGHTRGAEPSATVEAYVIKLFGESS